MTATATGNTTSDRLAVDLPVGWYQVGWTGELEVGGVKPLTAFGEQYVLYRAEDGAFHLMDAFCGHMGASLAHGGRVVGDCIVCPYHGWKWTAEGEVDDVPYSSRVNRGRQLRTRPVQVVSGLVFAWYHPNGDEPLWADPMPEIAEHGSARHYPIWPHMVREAEMNGHPQYVVENQVDAAHFVHVHNWSEYVQLDGYGADGHCFTSFARGTLNTRRGPVEQYVKITAWGVGILISRHNFNFGIPESAEDAGEVTTICTTPTTPGRAVLRMTTWLPRETGDDGPAPTGRAAALLRAGHREVFEHDWQIWDNMRYTQRPAYTREEARAFIDVRQWTGQYYPAPA
jgi:phenylpropionate dioxygenase-like ring-hydroxylating dioxygenase large terminal subunit